MLKTLPNPLRATNPAHHRPIIRIGLSDSCRNVLFGVIVLFWEDNGVAAFLYGLTGFDLIGIAGVALYLLAYAALQFGLLKGQDYLYPAVNALAAGCVLVSLVPAFHLSSGLIQIAWIVISAIGIARLYYFANHAAFSPEEREFLATRLSGLRKHHARRFLNLGRWQSGCPGTVLTREGEPVSHLIYLATGAAAVQCNGRIIVMLQEKSYVGEITCLSGKPATGTVVLTEPSLYFAVEVASLRRFLTRNVDAGHALESSFACDLAEKLVRFRDHGKPLLLQGQG